MMIYPEAATTLTLTVRDDAHRSEAGGRSPRSEPTSSWLMDPVGDPTLLELELPQLAQDSRTQSCHALEPVSLATCWLPSSSLARFDQRGVETVLERSTE